MCDPATIIAVAGKTAQIFQQQQQANTANNYEQALYGERKAQAFETFAAIQERQVQEREKAAQDIRQVTMQARQAAGAAKLQALESGTGGPSVGLLLDQFERVKLANIGIVQGNLAANISQLQEEARAAGRLQGPAKTFGPLSTPLGIIVSGLDVLGTAAQGAASAGAATGAG